MPPRTLAGQKAQATGDAWEQLLAQHVFPPLLREGVILRLDKLVPPVRVVSKGKGQKPALIPTAATGADWIGMLRDGRYLAMEAKSTSEPRLPRAAITPKQAEHLQQVAAGGGVALLLVEFRLGPGTAEHFAVPWMAAPWGQARTMASLDRRVLGAWRMKGWADLKRILENSSG